jgi:hypothetical protein
VAVNACAKERIDGRNTGGRIRLKQRTARPFAVRIGVDIIKDFQRFTGPRVADIGYDTLV